MTSHLRTIILFALAATILPAQTNRRTADTQSTGSVYHEPNGRYTLTVPAGWHIDTSQGNLKITSGDSWANFNTTSGPATPLAAAQKEAGQMQTLVSDWNVYSQGAYTTAAQHPAAGVSVTCTVASRSGATHRVMMFLAQSAGNGNYVTMTSSVDAPTGQKTSATLSQAFDSVRFANE